MNDRKFEFSVKELASSSGYSLDYFFKLLRSHKIDNRIFLDRNDLAILYKNLKIVNDKSYKLFISLKHISASADRE